MDSNIDTVKLSRLKRFTDTLSNNNHDTDPDISFECIIGSLFPDCFRKVKEAMKDQYTKGFIEGLKNNKI